MALFLSYASRDEVLAKEIVSDLEAAGYDVWFDHELHGGESWWQEILRRIRDASVFVLVVSSNSVRSTPCQAELGYARDLGLPVIPIVIDKVELRTLAVGEYQVVDYRDNTRAAGIALLRGVQQAMANRRPLPRPLPAAPPIPREYLLRLGRAIDGPAQLDQHDQVAIVAQLRQALKDEDDDGVRTDIRAMLSRLRQRSDLTYSAAEEIDVLLPRSKRRRGRGVPEAPRRQRPQTTPRGSQLGEPRPGVSGPLIGILVSLIAGAMGLLLGISILSSVSLFALVISVLFLLIRIVSRSSR